MPKAFYGGLFLAILSICAGLTLLGVKVHAISDKGPDRNEFVQNSGANANVWYEISDTTDVYAPNALVPVYFQSQPKSSVKINVSCGDGSAGISAYYLRPSDGAHIKFDGSICNNGYITLPAAAFPSTQDGTSGYFKATLYFDLNNSGYKAFRLDLTTGGALIGYSHNNTRFAIANLNRCDPSGDTSGCGVYSDYTFPFAPACSVTSGKTSFRLVDPDNLSSQPQNQQGKYSIQPNPFTTVLKEYDSNGTFLRNISTSKTVTNPGSTTARVETYTFNYVQGRKYKLIMNNVYSNNVIQFQLPFDSIYFEIPCTAGNISTSNAAGCVNITGYAYDKYDKSALVYYYIIANPAAGDAQTSYASFAAFTADLGTPAASGRADDPTPLANNGWGGHGFTVPISSLGTGYRGAWKPNTYYLYTREAGTATVVKVDTLSPNGGKPCASLSCTSAYNNFTFIPNVISPPFHVWEKTNQYAKTPLPDNYFTIRITAPDNTTAYYNTNVPAHLDAAAQQIYSDDITTFKPTQAGTYKIAWSYYLSWGYATTGCSDSDQSGYAPYLSVKGGDISAGPGFSNGTDCDESSVADIRSWNTGTSAAPNYTGGGSFLAALATGDITDFVSGMGLSGGAATQSGHALSFTNTANNSPPGYGGEMVDSAGKGVLPCLPDYYGTHGLASGNYTASTFDQSNFSGLTDPVSYISANDDGAMSGYALTLGGGNAGDTMKLAADRTVTLYVNGNVYIKNNILYEPYGLADAPRFNLYVSGNIYIDPQVTELHGVYVAQQNAAAPDPSKTGEVTTCATDTTGSSQDYATCNTQLKIVGAVASRGMLRMTRTHGNLQAVADPNVPGGTVPAEWAELFQYSPELWLNAPTTGTVGAQTYTSLPPVL